MRRPRRPGTLSPPGGPLTPSHAVGLGLVHGLCELLPVSSSAHVTLIPWLADWPGRGVDPELHKALEVSAHAGTALALAIIRRDQITAVVRESNVRGAALLVGAVAVPSATGLALERPIERRLGTPASIAVGLLAGSLAMLLGDRVGARHDDLRPAAQAGALDGLLLGMGQAAALIPGVSRNGATVAVARARHFSRADAAQLSHAVGLPVIAGAALLKGTRLARRPPPPAERRGLALTAAAAFASTVACAPLLSCTERGLSPLPFVAYRTALAVLVLVRLRRTAMRATVGDRRLAR